MNWIKFFKPTRSKMVVFILFLIMTTLLPQIGENCVMDIDGVRCYTYMQFGVGFPMFFGDVQSGCLRMFVFYPEMLVLNLIIYYLLSCVIVFFYERRSKV